MRQFSDKKFLFFADAEYLYVRLHADLPMPCRFGAYKEKKQDGPEDEV